MGKYRILELYTYLLQLMEASWNSQLQLVQLSQVETMELDLTVLVNLKCEEI